MTITLPTNAIYLSIRDPTRYQEWIALQRKSVSKNGYLTLQIDLPRKPRTTGKDSQCNCVNGYIRQIANDTGEDFDRLKLFFKLKAVSRGYPFQTDNDGNILYSKITKEPLLKSEADLTTVEAGYLIDTIIEIASEFGIKLKD